ncbi:MAG: hypothetical protein L0287_17990, partial [Anaerolineae bacterium]|nr:hypothetical protein [Anaerolineae bacterium]
MLGHSLPTNSPEVFLHKYPWVICVRGWGEESLISVLHQGNHIDLNQIPGIYFMYSGKIMSTSIQPNMSA